MTDTPQVDSITRAKAVVEREAQAVRELVDQFDDSLEKKVKAVGDVDPYGMIATGSSLVNAAACDALCVLLLERRGYSKEEFGVTHPGGAVGKKLAEEHN